MFSSLPSGCNANLLLALDIGASGLASLAMLVESVYKLISCSWSWKRKNPTIRFVQWQQKMLQESFNNQAFVSNAFVTFPRGSIFGTWVTTGVFGYSRLAGPAACYKSLYSGSLTCVSAGERDGPPENHPQRAARVYSDLHPWCGSQVDSHPAYLHPCTKVSSLSNFLFFLRFNAVLWMRCFCLT